jgi:hypothetical protein
MMCFSDYLVCGKVVLTFCLQSLAVKIRLVSVTNIQKITKSMKMVSAAKFARAERALRAGKVGHTSAVAIQYSV